MNSYREKEGDLIKLAKQGEFDVVVHGCNCLCTMKSGIAPQMAKAFKCNTFPKEHFTLKGDINKLGTIDYKAIRRGTSNYDTGFYNKLILDPALYVVNAYTQYSYGSNHADGVASPLDYHALKLCFTKLNHIFSGMKIGLPKIGAGLAKGDWNLIQKMIKESFTNCDVTVVIYKK
jgi:O-acetyl-ADP-ribose deacetylase (regulator of RNase III)